MADQKTTTYEDAVAGKAAKYAAGYAGPKPDTPYSTDGIEHVNPALNPAPPAPVAPERVPVPVINDPGVVGMGPDLATLNRAYAADELQRRGDEQPKGKRVEIDQTGASEEEQQQEITEAAQARQKEIEKQAKEQADRAVASVRGSPKPKIGSASSK